MSDFIYKLYVAQVPLKLDTSALEELALRRRLSCIPTALHLSITRYYHKQLQQIPLESYVTRLVAQQYWRSRLMSSVFYYVPTTLDMTCFLDEAPYTRPVPGSFYLADSYEFTYDICGNDRQRYLMMFGLMDRSTYYRLLWL